MLAYQYLRPKPLELIVDFHNFWRVEISDLNAFHAGWDGQIPILLIIRVAFGMLLPVVYRMRAVWTLLIRLSIRGPRIYRIDVLPKLYCELLARAERLRAPDHYTAVPTHQPDAFPVFFSYRVLFERARNRRVILDKLFELVDELL